MTRGDFTNTHAKTTQVAEKENTDLETSGWVTYKQLVDTDGEACVKAYINGRTMPFKHNPKVLEGSGVPWPENLLFFKEDSKTVQPPVLH